ncbi:hypothetical protein MMPV_005080 [Pyropia vietnamensis]
MSIVGAYATPLLTHPPRPPTPLPTLLASALRGALASASVAGTRAHAAWGGGGDDVGGGGGGGGGSSDEGDAGAGGAVRERRGAGAPPLPPSAVDGLIVCPSLAHPQFMPAHALAQAVGIPPTGRGRTFTTLTVEAGGASPVAATLLARSWVTSGRARLVAVVAGDAVASMATPAFLAAASLGPAAAHLPPPQVVAAYDAVAAAAVDAGWVAREDLAAVSVVAAAQAGRRPPVGVADVLGSRAVGRVTTQWECARRADGAAAVLVGVPPEEGGEVAFRGGGGSGVRLLGEGGEASSYLVPPPPPRDAWRLAGGGDCAGHSGGGEGGSVSGSGTPSRPSSGRHPEPPPGLAAASAAADAAYASAGLSPRDIDYWSVYDCFPIAFLLGAVATGLVPPGTPVGPWIRAVAAAASAPDVDSGSRTPADWPVNVGGGLLGGGAPWDAPALYGLVEAVAQLRGTARWPVRGGARTALCYGNGGVFSHAAVALLGREEGDMRGLTEVYIGAT